MGQYLNGNKIGTCESMYYMRLQTAQELAKQGRADDDGISFKSYLSDNQTKWRFPFPDEDKGIPADCQYNKGFLVPADNIEIDHSDICIHNAIDGVHGFNIFLPCPYSKAWQEKGISTSLGGVGRQFFKVVMEGLRDDDRGGREVKTIYECARCDSMFRLDEVDTQLLKQQAIEYYEVYKPVISIEGKEIGGNKGLYEYAMKVIDRIK